MDLLHNLKQHPKDQVRGIFFIIFTLIMLLLGMLKWFVSGPDANKAMEDEVLLHDTSVEKRHEKIPNACIDENVNLFWIRKYFTVDGWVQVLQVVKMKKANLSYYCQVCERKLLKCNTIC